MALLICIHPVSPTLIGWVGTSGKIIPVSGRFGNYGKAFSAINRCFCNPPPVIFVKGLDMEAHIAQWAKQVKASTEDNRRLNQLEREAQAVMKLQIARRSKPLTEQIEELMRSLPPPLRNRPWSMAELTARLQGKYRDRPHPQLVGAALRKLGWSRVRLYGNGFDGVRVWMPTSGCLIN